MNILAFSDIHNNLSAVRKLCHQESDNNFDLILIPGDLGSESIEAICTMVGAFACPVLFVLGNWDNKTAYDTSWPAKSSVVHHTVHQIENYFVTGFSGCPAHWGLNPIATEARQRALALYPELSATLAAAKEAETLAQSRATAISADRLQKKIVRLERNIKGRRTKVYKRARQALVDYENEYLARAYTRAGRPLEKIRATEAYAAYSAERRALRKGIAAENRRRLDAVLDGLPGDRTIVVTHERLYRLGEATPPPLLHLFGHRHQYACTTFRGTAYVNVAALDEAISVVEASAPDSPWEEQEHKGFNANVGGYCILTLDDGQIEVERKHLALDETRWRRYSTYTFRDRPYIPEEEALIVPEAERSLVVTF